MRAGRGARGTSGETAVLERNERDATGGLSLRADGYLDVTQAPYGADPTGVADATDALRRAIRDARDARLVTWLPGGRYKVSGTLVGVQGPVSRRDGRPFDYPCTLMGPGDGGPRATLVLADRAPGFGDTRRPKPVVHFWARKLGDPDSDEPQPSVSFNQMIVDIDIELGTGNPGAVGIHHQAAQGSVIEDVTIRATGAFAGLQRAPGSGGGVHGLTVLGGRYGLHLVGPAFWRGAQPVPVVSGLVLRGQSHAAILYNGRGPLTIVGADIDGAGIRSVASPQRPWDGALSVVDSVLKLRVEQPAIASTHSVVLRNVFVRNARVAARAGERWELAGVHEGWLHVAEYAAPAVVRYPERWMHGIQRQDELWIDRKPHPRAAVCATAGVEPPGASLFSRHRWPRPFPSRLSFGAATVRDARYGAKGDGRTDDTAAIQKAIDEHEIVFLPKGEYKISAPIRLHAKTRLVGAGEVFSTISPLPRDDAPAFSDVNKPRPLIETADDPAAETVLAFLELRVSPPNPAVYALRWRAGRRSVVRNVLPRYGTRTTAWQPTLSIPLVRIEGSGGGRWYNLPQHEVCAAEGPSFRNVRVEGTCEPLAFYMLNAEHKRCSAMLEFRNARNIDVYSLKGEGDFTVLWMDGCRNVRLFGYGGNGMPQPGWALIRCEDCTDFLLANLAPEHKPGPWVGPMGCAIAPERWFILSDRPDASEQPFRLTGAEQAAYWRVGQPRTNANERE
ncbi:MAG: hypothetical protein JXR37_01690 [Kiritimatiellae bacterium]|nr:hypothetical protein [Kiritimatiellia bacterium]